MIIKKCKIILIHKKVKKINFNLPNTYKIYEIKILTIDYKNINFDNIKTAKQKI